MKHLIQFYETFEFLNFKIRNEMESKKAGKGSFAYAWILDETEEERARHAFFISNIFRIEFFTCFLVDIFSFLFFFLLFPSFKLLQVF